MKKRIDINWLVQNHFVRMVEGQVIPLMERFTFLTMMEIGQMKVFFYTAQIKEDLLVLRKESYYVKSQDDFLHEQKIHVFKNITANQFRQMLEGRVIIVKPEHFTSLNTKEQKPLIALIGKNKKS